jgi:hypothetical protein
MVRSYHHANTHVTDRDGTEAGGLDGPDVRQWDDCGSAAEGLDADSAGGESAVLGDGVADDPRDDLMIVKRSRLRFKRYAAERESRELLVERASHLLAEDRTLFEAHWRWGMSVQELAVLRKSTPRAMRWRLNGLRVALMDPAFVLAVRFGPGLPRHLQAVARDYFVRGLGVREVAALQGKTVHQVRREAEIARSVLLMFLAREQDVAADVAAQAMLGAR